MLRVLWYLRKKLSNFKGSFINNGDIEIKGLDLRNFLSIIKWKDSKVIFLSKMWVIDRKISIC